jgi:catechol 2,3-dioxygenase-like lactoylglutathione lyase family enzyme
MPLALLEHVNLNVPDRDAAHAFYVEGLGGKVNVPSSNDGQLHVNAGASQFHLLLQYRYVEGPQKVTVPQVWSGHIELWSREQLSAICTRLTRLGHDASVEGDGVPGSNPWLVAHCPWGNKFIVRTAPAGFDPAVHGAHPSGSAGLIAITRAVHIVPHGAAARLHGFWSGVMGASSEVVVRGGSETAGAASSSSSHCIVRCTNGQQLIFDERADASTADAYDHDESRAYHICVYVDSLEAFGEAFRRCQDLGLLYANPRFAASPPHFGNALSWSEVESCGQFRIKDLRHAGGDAPDAAALVLEIEIRSVAHRSCPLSRADIVAGGATVAVPAAFANMRGGLKPPPHAKPGVIRIPHGAGGFGDEAKRLAAQRKKEEGPAPG